MTCYSDRRTCPQCRTPQPREWLSGFRVNLVSRATLQSILGDEYLQRVAAAEQNAREYELNRPLARRENMMDRIRQIAEGEELARTLQEQERRARLGLEGGGEDVVGDEDEGVDVVDDSSTESEYSQPQRQQLAYEHIMSNEIFPFRLGEEVEEEDDADDDDVEEEELTEQQEQQVDHPPRSSGRHPHPYSQHVVQDREDVMMDDLDTDAPLVLQNHNTRRNRARHARRRHMRRLRQIQRGNHSVHEGVA